MDGRIIIIIIIIINSIIMPHIFILSCPVKLYCQGESEGQKITSSVLLTTDKTVAVAPSLELNLFLLDCSCSFAIDTNLRTEQVRKTTNGSSAAA